jgi:hypothetical protein
MRRLIYNDRKNYRSRATIGVHDESKSIRIDEIEKKEDRSKFNIDHRGYFCWQPTKPSVKKNDK